MEVNKVLFTRTVTGATMDNLASFKSLAEIPSHPGAFLTPNLSICLQIKDSSTVLKLNSLSYWLLSVILRILGC